MGSLNEVSLQSGEAWERVFDQTKPTKRLHTATSQTTPGSLLPTLCSVSATLQRCATTGEEPDPRRHPGAVPSLLPPEGGFGAPHRVPWSRAGKRRARRLEAAAVAWQPRRGRPRWRRRGGGAAARPGLGSGAPGVSGARSRHRGTGPAPGSCPRQGWGAPSWVPGSPLGAALPSGAAGGGCPVTLVWLYWPRSTTAVVLGSLRLPVRAVGRNPRATRGSSSCLVASGRRTPACGGEMEKPPGRNHCGQHVAGGVVVS